ncbi:MAG: sugar phosphate isomerase/epimerase [Clostridia bacterium]|nr:sugar phosphate isomerase/epimerase [Clostridia bacterium]
MKIGFCAKLDKLQTVEEAGFAYIEPSVTSVLDMDDAGFAQAKAALEHASIPASSFNVLFPKQMQLFACSEEELRTYLEKAFSRVQELGGRTVVFGSGKSRMRPEGMPYGEAFRKLCDITRVIGDVAEKYGITLVVEPLNTSETNMINSVAEGADLVAAVHHPAVKLLADYYHIAVEHDRPGDLERLGGIAHAHIATEIGRRIPLVRDDGYLQMFAAMKHTGYEGNISIEGKSDNLLEDGLPAIAMLTALWEEA